MAFFHIAAATRAQPSIPVVGAGGVVSAQGIQLGFPLGFQAAANIHLAAAECNGQSALQRSQGRFKREFHAEPGGSYFYTPEVRGWVDQRQAQLPNFGAFFSLPRDDCLAALFADKIG